ncbi:peptidoglycan-binding protein [Alsobacter sp. SYSU M60028]|uniref:Peptidoglycan-binding protein n=1 Tax=Alsobacter ponti TaxID=2962936 RepID=A0ABT1LAL1_9HYPH|nr:peptidoglycan-binding domain-containing protein [Alsobacter ponti]MCP8937805.1 peptidoglycan-binding protein [Alsobacter ponti]
MLARADHDFVLGQVRPSRKGQKRRRWQWLRALFRKPGRVVVGATGAAVGVGIIINALALQGGPHPAPLFQGDARPAASAARPLPPARPADLAQPAAAVPAQPTTPRAPAAAPAPAPAAASSRDAIADMLRGGATPAPAAVEPSRAVLAAQRALNKLNYGPVKPDGLMGPGTKQAIERFERDRRLPVTGEASGRTARELASASGVPVE